MIIKEIATDIQTVKIGRGADSRGRRFEKVVTRDRIEISEFRKKNRPAQS